MKSGIHIVLGLLLAGMAQAEVPIPADKDVILFESKLGKVTFHHRKHADMSITQCTTCHHTFKPEEDAAVKACSECHGTKKTADVPALKDSVHLRCQGCHQYTIDHGGHAGPTKKECKLCHIKG